MPEILITARGPEDWRRVLAEPDKHWCSGYSARALAYCSQSARDFPPSVRGVFSASPCTLFHKIKMLVGIVEHRVPPPGRGYRSQTDLFVLAKSGKDLVSIAVEGKVSGRISTDGGRSNRMRRIDLLLVKTHDFAAGLAPRGSVSEDIATGFVLVEPRAQTDVG